MIDVIIVEDDHDVSMSLKSILESDREINVVGMADNGLAAVELADRLTPNLMLMDIKLPGLNGLEASRRIKDNFEAKKREIKILILSTFYDDDYVAKSQEYGVDGYLLKGLGMGKLATAIKNTCNGFVTLDRIIYDKQNLYARSAITKQHDHISLADKKTTHQANAETPADINSALFHIDRTELKSLSETELKILKSIANGKTNADIAGELYLSKGTVKNYISRILLKLECKNGRELAALGSRVGL